MFDLSGKIDEQALKVLCDFKMAADMLGIPFIVVGAYARDIILKNCYGIASPRMTMDIDLGVEVASWDQFDQLVSSLMSTGKFTSTNQRHQYFYGTTRIDIIPFGAIVDPKRTISWPPEYQVSVSLLGFQEAYENAVTIRLCSEPLLDVKLPSLPGLAVMKLIAWRDRCSPERKKDAQDLLFIMSNYAEAGNSERLYTDDSELLPAEDFDNELAGIRLLGRDMAMIVGRDTSIEIRDILATEINHTTQSQLIIDMLTGGLRLFDKNFEDIKLRLEKLREGFVESVMTKR